MHQQAAQTPTVSSPSNSYPLENFIETRGFRPEIQGLRAFAVLLVVLYHVWFGRVSGGVDVFLFISAFLLSLSNMRKINEGRNAEMNRKTSTPPDTLPNQTWYSTTRSTANARRP